ncbi:MAG: DNA methyltransferase [Bacteroidota bacterium]
MSELSLKYVKGEVGLINERDKLFEKFKDIIDVDLNLDRTLVSFQANKKEPYYRWFKYKEGFSKRLVYYYLDKYHPSKGHILDPFAGSGATLFAAREKGWKTTGIELLPSGIYNINARLSAERINYSDFKKELDKFWMIFDETIECDKHINHIPITKGAFPNDNEENLNRYLTACKKIENDDVRALIEFAAFTVLEDISYTRKDGQYLRWDYRANRSYSEKEFNKGIISNFLVIIKEKLEEICNDLDPNPKLELFLNEESKIKLYDPNIIQGSSLEILPKLESEIFDFVLTSPPYCNRYDYTRTYALELIFLKNNEEDIRNLRQTMLTCTVENKDKLEYLRNLYNELNRLEEYNFINNLYFTHPAMSEINNTLLLLNNQGILNNANIPRMVKNYFYEMVFIIYELYRLLKNGGVIIMVNDNVRYGGEEIPVDLVLSDFAERIGFRIKKIWTLPVGKGNSSQQMGEHGRSELRKCVYVWEK